MNLFSAACFILVAYSRTVLADVACTTRSDCGIGGTCAMSEVSTAASLVCCSSGGRRYIFSKRREYVCTELAAGMKCGGENRVCASGVCGMDDLCRQEPLGNESPCRNDAQCASAECARSEADAEAGLVCCTSGGSKSVSTVLLNPKYVCTGLAAGMKCGGENRVCTSGVCGMDDLCRQEFASPAAKNDYINDSADCPLDKLAPPDANDISSVSIGFGTWLDVGQVPNKGVIVGQEVLGGVDKCLGSFVAQRQGSQVCFSYQREDDNGGGNSSFACVKKCIDVCARNAICYSDRFEKYTTDSLFSGKTCYVSVQSENAEADGNNEEYELFEADVTEDIFFGDPDVAEDIFFGDPDVIEDMFDDPDAIEDILLDTMAALSQAQRRSTGIIASVRISLFAAASHVLLFWFW